MRFFHFRDIRRTVDAMYGDIVVVAEVFVGDFNHIFLGDRFQARDLLRSRWPVSLTEEGLAHHGNTGSIGFQ